jgi:uncharacterized Zn-binding protein involved in type VI secretion
MLNSVRVGDIGHNPSDTHGRPCCSHDVAGPVIAGSPNVFVNGRPKARITDPGVHSTCCGPNTFVIAQGSPNVFTNGLNSARLTDMTAHCGGPGTLVTGSRNVYIN